MNRRGNRGVSLLELIITLLVLGVVTAVAFPSFVTLMANQRIKTATESMRSGLQVARMEALKRGRGVVFDMSNLDSSWIVGCEIPVADDNDGDGQQDCPSQIQISASTTSGNAIAITTDTGTLATFSPLGLVRQLNQDGTAPFTQVNVTAPDVTSDGLIPLRILLQAGGLSRICDPEITTDGDMRKC